MMQEIYTFIKERHGTISDKELNELIDDKFSTAKLTFPDCSSIDNKLYPEHHRGYWRAAFGFPNNGDEVRITNRNGETRICVVEDSAFFTMNVELK